MAGGAKFAYYNHGLNGELYVAAGTKLKEIENPSATDEIQVSNSTLETQWISLNDDPHSEKRVRHIRITADYDYPLGSLFTLYVYKDYGASAHLTLTCTKQTGKAVYYKELSFQCFVCKFKIVGNGTTFSVYEIEVTYDDLGDEK